MDLNNLDKKINAKSNELSNENILDEKSKLNINSYSHLFLNSLHNI